jgi:DNA-binding CsgD family transcriptional regulator
VHEVVRRSPVVVGREMELARLRGVVHAGQGDTPRAAFVVGEAGIGKSRLLAEVVREAQRVGLAVLSGRASTIASVAFGIVAGALRSHLRDRPVDDAALDPFAHGIRLVLPEWPVGAERSGLSDAQLRLLALEGCVQLVRHIAQSGPGALLILDDLHAADAESIEAIRHIVTAGSERVRIVGALRPNEPGPAEPMVRALAQEGVVDVLDLAPLDRPGVAVLLASLLDAAPPAELVDDVVDRTDGLPLLVEELLAAHLASGTVAIENKSAVWKGGRTPVPRTVSDMAKTRLARLRPEEQRIVIAGAVLGTFDPPLLQAVVELDDISAAVAGALDAGLIEPSDDGVDFRHALIREAVVASAVPHDLWSLHRRAASVLADRPADDLAAAEERARHLREVAEHDEAATVLASVAEAKLARHALLAAETTALEACDAARSEATGDLANDVLARAYAAQGRWADALALDETADEEAHERRVRMATCAFEVSRFDLAASLIDRARSAGAATDSLSILEGRLALARGDERAAIEAGRAVAERATEPRVVCAAIDLEARALDYGGARNEAREAYQRLLRVASSAGSTEWRVRALVQLGGLEVLSGQPPNYLLEASRVARECGALVEQAWADLNLASAVALQGDPRRALAIAEEGEEHCRAFRIDVLPFLVAARAVNDAYVGGTQTVALFEEAQALAPENTELAITVTAMRADIAMQEGRYEDAVNIMQTALDALRSSPGGAPTDTLQWYVLALAAAGRHEEAAVALEEARAQPDLARWHARAVVLAGAEAIVARDEAGVDAAFELATGRQPFDLALLRVIAAEVLGGPNAARWLREALDIYESCGVGPHFTDRVRRLLREAGGAVPRRKRAPEGLSDDLASRGVTAREAEVLQLLGDGAPNAVIAQRLYLSVRTVESHVSSLLRKLDVEGRSQLIAVSARMAARINPS